MERRLGQTDARSDWSRQDEMAIPNEVLSMMQDRADGGDHDCPALMHKFRSKGGAFQKGAGGGRQQPRGDRRAEPPPRDKKDVTIANGGIKCHLGQDCRKPKVEFSMIVLLV